MSWEPAALGSAVLEYGLDQTGILVFHDEPELHNSPGPALARLLSLVVDQHLPPYRAVFFGLIQRRLVLMRVLPPFVECVGL